MQRGEASLRLLPCVVLVLWAAVAHGATSPLRLGAISSATGALTDWNETVKGYQFAVQYLMQRSPSGIPVIDSRKNTYYVPVTLSVLDDGSSAAMHSQLLTQLLAPGGSDVILNANPSFAAAEALAVSNANKINIHAVTGSASVFSGLSGVFGIVPSSTGFTTALFQAYRVSSMKKVAVLLRSDNDELKAACSAAELNAKQYLITYTEIGYTAADNLTSIAVAVNNSGADALCACISATDASTIYRQLDAMRRPLKNVFFTNGPQQPAWNAALGNLSYHVTAPAFWASSMSGASYTDTLFGTAQEFSIKFSSWSGSGGKEPSDYAAAASAATLVLWLAFSDAFTNCDLTAIQGDAQQLLYNTTALRCDDNLNNGMQRLARSIQQLSTTSFFGSIGFNRQGQNYAGSIGLAQVFSVTQDLKQFYVPQLVAPISAAVKSLVLPQKNRYAPVCPPGSYQNPDDYLPCIPCPKGQFQDRPGQGNCEICAKNTYSNATSQVSCYQCPLNTVTSERGSSSSADCVCQVGFYNAYAAGGYACNTCPNNADCAGGTDLPRPTNGWYAERDSPFTMYNCNPNLVCEGNFSCAAGYTGRMCSYCDAANGYFMALSRCYKCPSNGLIVLFMALMMFIFIVLNTGVTRQIETFIVLVNFCQLLSLINGFNANWPSAISNLMNFASVLAFEPDCIQPQCLSQNWSFEDNLMFQLLMPLIILGFTVLWTIFTYMTYLGKRWLDGSGSKEESQVDSSFAASFSMTSRVVSRTSNDEGSLFAHKGSKQATDGMSSLGSLTKYSMSNWVLVLQNIIPIPQNPAEMMECVYDRLSIPLMFLNSSYMATLKYCLSAFFCHDFAGTKYMYYMTKEQCYSPKHYQLMLIALAGLAVYCLGLWAMVIQVLSHLKKTRSFGDKVPLLLFGWIYDMYDIKYYWFEVVSIFHRTAMTVIMVFMLDYTDVQLLVAFIITGVVLIIQVRTAAITDFKARTMDIIGDALLLVVIVIGLMLNNPDTLPSTADGLNNTLMAIVIGYLCAAGIIIVVEVVFIAYTSLLMSRHNNIAKKWGHKIKRFKHMYKVFTPMFMIRWLSKARAAEWQEWHRLGLFLADYVHPTSETSYLSDRKVGRFWRFLLRNFPEILDYLATVNPQQREHFNRFIETMYIDFFDSADEHAHQLNHIVNENYRAPFAQWLSQAEDDEVTFLKNTVQHAYESVKGKAAGMQLHRAMSRYPDGNVKVPLDVPGMPTWSGDKPARETDDGAGPRVSALSSMATPNAMNTANALPPKRTKFQLKPPPAENPEPTRASMQSEEILQGSSEDGASIVGDSPRTPASYVSHLNAPGARDPGTQPSFQQFTAVELMSLPPSAPLPSTRPDVPLHPATGLRGSGLDSPLEVSSPARSQALPAPVPVPVPVPTLFTRVSSPVMPRSSPETPSFQARRPATSAATPAPAPAQMEGALSDLVQAFRNSSETTDPQADTSMSAAQDAMDTALKALRQDHSDRAVLRTPSEAELK